MQYAHLNKVSDVRAKIALGIVAPDGRQAMIEHAAQFAAAGIPFIFDPGQGLPMFTGAELEEFIERPPGWRSTTTNGASCSKKQA